MRRTRASGRIWLLPAESEGDADSHVEEILGGGYLTLKEKEIFALVLKRRTNPETSRSCTPASTQKITT